MRQIKTINNNNKSEFHNQVLVESMYKLRGEVFKNRLGWEVELKDGLEIDDFDNQNPSYVLAGLTSQQSSAWPSAIAIGIFFMGTHSLFLVPYDATASLTAKTIVLVIAALWVRSSLKSRFETKALGEEDILRLDHEQMSESTLEKTANPIQS